MTLTALKYFGSKGRLIKKLVPALPNHRHYVSLFGGSAADILGKPRSHCETYNDMNQSLTTFFQVLQRPADCDRLCRLAAEVPLSRDLYKDFVRFGAGKHDDQVMVAFGVFYSSFLSFGGQIAGAISREGIAVCSDIPVKARWRNAAFHLRQVARRFHDVWVENKPWQEVIAKFDAPTTLFYADPPYLRSTRKTFNNYRHEMTDDQHVELLMGLRAVKGYVVLSGYASDLYDEQLADWRRIEFPTRCTVSDKMDARIEVVWMNYDEQANRIA